MQEQHVALSIEQQGIGAARRYVIRYGDKEVRAHGELAGQTLVADVEGHRLQATVAEHDGRFSLYSGDCAIQFCLQVPDLGESELEPDINSLVAPMNGTMVALLVEAGSHVSKGDQLLIMEAMKMEHSICAPANGVVSQFYYQAGEQV